MFTVQSAGNNKNSSNASQEKEILDCLSLGFEQGVKGIFQRTNSFPMVDAFSTMSIDIITKLAERGNNAAIIIQKNNINIHIKEVGVSVVITVGSRVSKLRSTTFNSLQYHLLNDVLENLSIYSVEAVNNTINHTIIKADNYPSLFKKTACYLMKEPKLRIHESFKATLETHLFMNKFDYIEEDIVKIAQFIILQAAECQKMCIEYAAQHIMINAQQYDLITIRSAAFYIVKFPDHYNHYANDVFNLAIAHITEYLPNFDEQIITQAAIEFIQRNLDFFTAHRERQLELASFFSDKNELEALKNYSTSLIEILFSDKNVYHVELENISSDDAAIQEISLLALWNLSQFDTVLMECEQVSLFILQNSGHKAITLWNART